MANIVICPKCSKTNHRVLRVDPTETTSKCWDCHHEFVWGCPGSKGPYLDIYPCHDDTVAVMFCLWLLLFCLVVFLWALFGPAFVSQI